MEVTGGEEEGFVREWAPCTHMLNLIPARVQTGLFSHELCLTCIDAVEEYIALGTNIGLVYWYDRKKGNIQRLRCELSTSPITFVKIANTVDYMVGAGNVAGQVTVFQIPKEHPENIPDELKPKVEPKVERYTIGDLHKSPVTAIEWSKNGMRLFSGDKNGVIIMSEIDFYMHLCKSQEVVNEGHEIVQLGCHGARLLAASVYRCVVCERRGGRWRVAQVGRKERKALSRLGCAWWFSWSRGGEPELFCARAGQRLWRADAEGRVQQTLLFKEAISNPLTVVELLNPSRGAAAAGGFGRVHAFREEFLVSHDEQVLYILDPRSLTAVAVVDNLRRILSVSVHKDEIFVLEGPRCVLRLGRAPERHRPHAEGHLDAMSRSLSSSLQQAVSSVRDLALIDHTVPFIASVLEQPISMFTKNEVIDPVIKAEECFELPPIKTLPRDISADVLESIVNEFRDVTSETEELRRVKSLEIEKKLKLYNSIMEKQYDSELIHSRKSKKNEVEVKEDVSYTSPCVMNVSVYSNIPQETDDALERQIEEKEKILAKMLNLESLSIKSTNSSQKHKNQAQEVIDNVEEQDDEPETITKTENPVIKKPEPVDLVPKLVKLPNNWNLNELELKVESPKLIENDLIKSPDDHIETEWELV